FGKYVAMLVFTFVLVLMIYVTVGAMAFAVNNVDFSQLAGSSVGIFLETAAYASMGLFISSLTSYQIVAAIATFALFAIFSTIGTVGQDIDFVRRITYFLNMPSKMHSLTKGVLNVRDISYLLILIGTFLSFTILTIKSSQESISRIRKISRYAVVILLVFIFGYISDKPSVNAYMDTTRNKLFTITPATQKVLAEMDDSELEITVFGNIFFNRFVLFSPTRQNELISNVWEPYIRFKPNIKIDFKYYYALDSTSSIYTSNAGKTLSEIAEKYANSNKMDINQLMTPDEARKLVDIDREEYRCFFLLKYKGKETVVRVFTDLPFYPGENEISAALNRLLYASPKILFLTDEIERNPFSERTRDYKFIASKVSERYSLVNQGFDVDTISLIDKDIPNDIAALAIVDPRKPFSPDVLNKIDRYVQNGGNLYLVTEPDRREICKPVLDLLGVSAKEGRILQSNPKNAADYITTYISQAGVNLSPMFEKEIKKEIRYSGDTLMRVAMSGASVLEFNQDSSEFEVTPLLSTDPKLSWNRVTPIDPDSLNVRISKQSGEEQGSFATVIKMERKVGNREQRIIVSSDADYLTEPMFKITSPKTYNYLFGFYSFSYFTYNQFPANTIRPDSKDNSFKIKVADIAKQKLVLYWIIPAMIAVIGAFIIIRRKRK
ncbi:MAG TPA: Gldg family protein, partial [Cytophagaceae bacterium]